MRPDPDRSDTAHRGADHPSPDHPRHARRGDDGPAHALFASPVVTTLATPLRARAAGPDDAWEGAPEWSDPAAEVAWARLVEAVPDGERAVAADPGTTRGTIVRSLLIDARVRALAAELAPADTAGLAPGAPAPGGHGSDPHTRDENVPAAPEPRVQIVALGAGACTRPSRLADLDGVHWAGVDLPAAVEVRAALLGPHDPIHVVAASIDDPSWRDVLVPGVPVIAVAEGLLMFIGAEATSRMLDVLAGHDAEVALIADLHDVACAAAPAEVTARTGARIALGVDATEDLAALGNGWTAVGCEDGMAPMGPEMAAFARDYRARVGHLPYADPHDPAPGRGSYRLISSRRRPSTHASAMAPSATTAIAVATTALAPAHATGSGPSIATVCHTSEPTSDMAPMTSSVTPPTAQAGQRRDRAMVHADSTQATTTRSSTTASAVNSTRIASKERIRVATS